MKTYRIKITLKSSKPNIWRRLLVPADLLLPDLHYVIQAAMGWTNSHLHQFIKDRTYYMEKSHDDDLWEEMDNVDYQDIKISKFLKKNNDKFIYEYDFGDCWEHEIRLEEILLTNENNSLICLAGKNNCPPEDCGGVWGYMNMLEILKQPDHEEYESYLEWLGGKFDPKHFDIEEVNEELEGLR